MGVRGRTAAMNRASDKETLNLQYQEIQQPNGRTLAAGLFSGLSPFDEDDICLSRDWLLFGQSGLDDIMLPEAGRGGYAELPLPLIMFGGVRPRGGPGGAEQGSGG